MLLAALASPALAADPHPFSVHDMLAMQRLSDPRVSPDGTQVLFTLRTTDLEANRGRTDLWLVALDGKTEPLRLTADPAADFNGRWLPDGRIAFLSTRSESSQIWTIDPRGGEAVQVTRLPLDVENFEVVPQLEAYAFSLAVYPDATIAETVARDADKAATVATGRTYDELFFRRWDTWEDGKRNHVFLRPWAGTDEQVRDLTPGLDADAPTLPFGGSEEFAFSRDGRTLVFAARIKDGSEAAWSTDDDLYAVSTDSPSRRLCLTEANEAQDTQPVFSPDGRTLAWLAMDRPGFEADRYHVVLRAWPDGTGRRLDLDYDNLSLSPGSLLWSADGKAIYVTAPYLGQHAVFALDVASGKARLVVRDGGNGSLRLAGKRLLYTKQHLRSPDELHTCAPAGGDERRLTHINDATLAACRMGEPEQFTFKGWNDETVHAYLVKPYDWTAEAAAAGRTWPVAFLVHGGPQGSFGNDFHYRWNPQAYVGAGFATVAVDFHGSTGYGQPFTDAIRHHWGDRPLEDLEKGLAAALADYPWLDGSRVVAAGASYGGYMINWMHGQPFGKKFRAFVCHDGNLDERMAYYDTEELWFPEWEHGGTPWTEGSGFALHNPADYVQNWSVPTLVVHGGLDYRVVDTQGLSTFTALRRLGVPARLLYFPDENHWVLKPANSIQWHDEVMGWL
ncbi:S9 family peptidase, partial [bacterium]|nr:S9 family peptidase [bacterium]